MDIATSANPATGKTIQIYDRPDDVKINELIEKTHVSFLRWKETPISKRAALMFRAGEILEQNKLRYATIITGEMGKTYLSAIKEVEKCAWVMKYFSENAEKFLEKEILPTDAEKSYVVFSPLGVILAIMPWNFPFYQAIRFAAPTLMAGNTAVLKHASNVQGCAFALEELFKSAGFPEFVFTNLNIGGNQVRDVIENPLVAAVTLTGSESTGREVASIAGAVLKKCVMELGGSDACIILGDLPVEEAVQHAVTARLQNNGETCIAAKRFIAVDEIYDEFVQQLTLAMQAQKMGDPFDEETVYGPLARPDLRNQLHRQVTASISKGARLTTGGYIPDLAGAWYPATVLAEVKPGMPAFDEELFGPVAAIIRAKDATEAVVLANQSRFGLGASVLTGDAKTGEKLAAEMLEAGSCFVNHLVVSDPRLPFGGIKNSGFGRELSAYGIKEFVNIKTVWIDEWKAR